MRMFVLSLTLAFLLQAQPADKQANVDRIFSGFNTHTPGCAVGVAHNGAVVLKSGYGMADLERSVPQMTGEVARYFAFGARPAQATLAAIAG